MSDEKNIAAEIGRLEQKRIEAIAAEKILREAAFLHSEKFPLHENIAGFPALPLCLFHCDLLRMMRSPFMPPFETPTPEETAAFLWVVSPQFNRDTSGKGLRLKNAHYKKCRKFNSIAPLILQCEFVKWKRFRSFLSWRWGKSMVEHTNAVIAARNYVAEALADRPMPRSENGIQEPNYYSEFAAIVDELRGIVPYEKIMFEPLKVIYQLLKRITERNAKEAGVNPLLENGSDRFTDEQLALLNRRN